LALGLRDERNEPGVGSYLRGIAGYNRDVKFFLLYNLLANVGIGVFMLLFNLYLRELDFREDFIGEFQAISTLAMAGVSITIGVLISRVGVWKSVFAGLILFLVTSVLASIVTDPLILRGFAALNGAGTAFLFVPTMPFIVDLTRRHERHGVAALAFSLQSLSTTVGSLIGGWMPRLFGTILGVDTPSVEAYRYTLIAGVLVAALGLLPLLAMSSERRNAIPQDVDEAGPGEVEIEREPAVVRQRVMVFVAVGGLMSLGAGAVFPFYNVFLESIDFSAGQIGLVYSAGGLMAAGLGLMSPYVARRLGSVRAVVLVRLAPVPFYFLLMATPLGPIAIFAHMLRNTSINMAWPIDSTYVSEILPAKARASVFSYRSGAWNLGWALSSWITGQAIVRYGYNVSFAAYSIFMLLAMGLYYVYFSGISHHSAADNTEAGESTAAAG
jgi:predicted MFS family arabinose efflux permease